MPLFPNEPPVLLAMPDADVRYLRRFSLRGTKEQLFEQLMKTVPWKQKSITVWGKTHPQPRLVAWYGDPGRRYGYSGIVMEASPWSEVLVDLRADIAAFTGAAFNSVLVNLYRDQRDSMGFHADDEPELGPRPTIASLSLGEERTLVFKHRTRDLPPARITLASGSLLVMRGETQHNWFHGIHKLTRPCGPRINLTFRYIFP